MARNFLTLLGTKYRYKRGQNYLAGIEDRKQEIGPANPSHTYYRAQTGTLEKQTYLDFRAALKIIRTLARDHNTPVVLLYIPDASQLNDKKRQHVNRFISENTDDLGLAFIDATTLFEANPDQRELYLFPLDAHTSSRGHEILASAIARKIEELGLL